MNHCSIDLYLTVSYDKTYARRGCGHAHQTAAGEKRNCGL